MKPGNRWLKAIAVPIPAECMVLGDESVNIFASPLVKKGFF